jgi:hypothetical protein
MSRLNQLRPEDFEPLVGLSMPVELHSGTLACELTKVHRLPPHALREHPPFALILRGPREQPLRQGTYALLHPEHGRLELFMVPIGPDGGGWGYEITFN